MHSDKRKAVCKMATPMTSKERILRMYEHKEADRVPMIEEPWDSTIERWEKEGVTEWWDAAGLDRIGHFGVDNTPPYPENVIEETDDYIISTTAWGATIKDWKHATSTPQFLDFKITDLESWHEAKRRMKFDPSRIEWDELKQVYPLWQRDGAWTVAELWFGFDVTHSWMTPSEDFLMALIDDPDWCKDIYETQLKGCLQAYDCIWDAGYRFDCVYWPDDMGYKQAQFFSLNTYRELSKPYHKMAADWAHEKGAKVCLHSCGDIRPFIPDIIDAGIDGLNPLEVKAGMDPYKLKDQYGDKLVLFGGLNALDWANPDKIEEEVRRLVPHMKKNGGYIYATDHSVPDNISFKDFNRIMDVVRELGKY